jgi:hypothetical protein
MLRHLGDRLALFERRGFGERLLFLFAHRPLEVLVPKKVSSTVSGAQSFSEWYNTIRN